MVLENPQEDIGVTLMIASSILHVVAQWLDETTISIEISTSNPLNMPGRPSEARH